MMAGLGAASILSGCTSHAATAFLKGMERWNEHLQSAIYSPNRIASEPPSEDLTPDGAFPSYFVSETMPFPPAGWTLKVGGMVAHPQVFSLDQLRKLPRASMRMRHHCV